MVSFEAEITTKGNPKAPSYGITIPKHFIRSELINPDKKCRITVVQ